MSRTVFVTKASLAQTQVPATRVLEVNTKKFKDLQPALTVLAASIRQLQVRALACHVLPILIRYWAVPSLQRAGALWASPDPTEDRVRAVWKANTKVC